MILIPAKWSLVRRKGKRRFTSTSTLQRSSTGNQCKIYLWTSESTLQCLTECLTYDKKIPRCNLCGKETPSGSSNLMLHLRHHHPQVRTQCLAWCNFSYVVQIHLHWKRLNNTIDSWVHMSQTKPRRWKISAFIVIFNLARSMGSLCNSQWWRWRPMWRENLMLRSRLNPRMK